MKHVSNRVLGISILVLAALFWGIGNTITGITAWAYQDSGSLLPSVDIALANTVGGLWFLATWSLLRSWNNPSVTLSTSPDGGTSRLYLVLSHKYLFAGSFKGANTALFVFSTTFIVATQSLILESTYVIWSLAFGFLLLGRRIPLASTLTKVLLLFTGLYLIVSSGSSGSLVIPTNLGTIFGLLAGLTYALYLMQWAQITPTLDDIQSKLASTSLMLLVSMGTILVLSEVFSLILLRKFWIPFTNLARVDLAIQLLNGVLVIGIVYLMITFGMSYLRKESEGADFIASVCLSFSIPFTSLTEFLIGKFVPTTQQMLGVAIFVVAFILISEAGNT